MRKNNNTNNCFWAAQEVKENKDLYNLISRHGFSVKALKPLAGLRAHEDLRVFMIKRDYIKPSAADSSLHYKIEIN